MEPWSTMEHPVRDITVQNPKAPTAKSTAWPESEAHARPPTAEGRRACWDERGTDSEGFEEDAQETVRDLSRFGSRIGMSSGLIYSNSRHDASVRYKEFQQKPPRVSFSADVPSQAETGAPVAGTAFGGDRLSAKDSWRQAIKSTRKEARAKLDKQRREANARQELRRDVWDAAKAFVIFAVVVMSLGTVLFLVERDELYERTKDKFVFADRLGSGYCAWMGAVYIGYLSAHRVGYGDILLTTAAGKWLVMLFASLTTPLSVIFTLKCSKLMKRFVGNLSDKLFARHDGKFVDAFFVSSFMAALLILMVVNMFFLVTLRGDDGERLTYTDAFWYSWATYTTVGYGDIGFATLPSVTLFAWAVQYCFFVIGAVIMDTLISCAYTMLVEDGEDESQGTDPEIPGRVMNKVASKPANPSSVSDEDSEDSQSQNGDAAASPVVQATSVPERLEIRHIEEP